MAEMCTIQAFNFDGYHLQLCIPDEMLTRKNYAAAIEKGENPVFPYWAKLWPAATGLCKYLHRNQQLLKTKTVLELAAGLGLPSLYAALHAKHVISSDYVHEALDVIQQSANVNCLDNLETTLIDWQFYPPELQADVVLLSDVNYDPKQFAILVQLIERLLQNGTTIILSTPQRIMAKSFIEQLLPFCRDKEEMTVETIDKPAEIFVMQLEKQG